MLNVLSLFSGIGAFEKALENLGMTVRDTGTLPQKNIFG